MVRFCLSPFPEGLGAVDLQAQGLVKGGPVPHRAFASATRRGEARKDKNGAQGSLLEWVGGVGGG